MGGIITKYKGKVLLIFILMFLSAVIYFIQYLIFNQTQSTLFYFFQDLAFIPIQVMLVTIILNRFLNIIDARKKVKKINVIISAFFVEAGASIMNGMSELNKNNDELIQVLKIDELNKVNENIIKKKIKDFKYDIYADPEKLGKLGSVLDQYRDFTLNMLGNDNLLEHDSFTDMLWAVFHVDDELNMRKDFKMFTKNDTDHLSIDILRAYSAVLSEWIGYLRYLHDEYPFLYVIAIKKAKSKISDKNSE